MISNNLSVLCFDLSFDATVNSFLPNIYVLNEEDSNYIDKIASPEVLKSIGIDIETFDAATKTLFAICDDLKKNKLFNKFEKAAKSKKTFDDLRKDSKTNNYINLYLKTKIDTYLRIISEKNFSLSINLGKSKELYNCRVSTSNPVLKVVLKFEKNETGIDYTLFLKENETIFYPLDCKVETILDNSNWLVVNRKLHQLEDIECRKINPFLKNKTIKIPNQLVETYFEKFIKDIVKKVDIEATGFEVVQKKEMISCSIISVYDFLKKDYGVELCFDYDGNFFKSTSTKLIHSDLELNSIDDIKVIQFKRNLEQEKHFDKILLKFNFDKDSTGLFKLKNKEEENNLSCIDFLIKNKKKLVEHGFLIPPIEFNQGKIQSEIATISMETETKSDWFDVKMTIFCGSFEFSFSEIVNNIKDNNRYFKLPDETYFLIPLEWMTLYAPLVNFAKISNNLLVLPKSNYTILENLTDFQIGKPIEKKTEFVQSNLLKATLRPYQIEGVKWLLEHYYNGLGACLADDMGLGKTLQTLALLVAVQEQLESNKEVELPESQLDIFETTPTKETLKALIVLPSSLVFNWQNESKKFTPHFKSIQYTGNNRKAISKKLHLYDLVFTSYAIVSRDVAVFEKYDFRYLILDESQQIKNRDSKIFKAINSINAAHKISLSGTPIENSLNDLWSQMQFINPEILRSFKFFTNYFKIPIEKDKDENVTEELKSIIAPFILRRTKEQVLDDLPELTEQVYFCEMDKEQEKWYEEEKSKARNQLLKIDIENINKINVFNTLMKLRQLSNHPKIVDANSEMESGKFVAVTNYIETLLKSNQKMLIFSSFVNHLAIYQKWCKDNKINFCLLTGETPVTQREQEVTNFQNDSTIPIFFISLKAGGIGLNLTKASFVLMLDPWWNPFSEKQAIARAHRMGQKNKVNAVRFIAKNSIEEKILQLQENKKLLSDTILDENSLVSGIESNLEFLLS